MAKFFDYIVNEIKTSCNIAAGDNRYLFCRLYRGRIAVDLSAAFPFSVADTKRTADYLNMAATYNDGFAAAECFCNYYAEYIRLLEDYLQHIRNCSISKSDQRLIADLERLQRKLVKDHSIIANQFDIAAVGVPGAAGADDPTAGADDTVPAAVGVPGAAGGISSAITLRCCWWFFQPFRNTMQPFKKRSTAVFDTS